MKVLKLEKFHQIAKLLLMQANITLLGNDKNVIKVFNLSKFDNMVNFTKNFKEWPRNITVFKNLQKFLTMQKPNNYNQTVEF